MLTPRNVIYGFCLFTNPQKPKYLISLYRGFDLEIIACFTTSQERAGVPQAQIKHGKMINYRGDIVSYVFEAGRIVGQKPDGTPFSFPKRTFIPFDYCFQSKSQEELIKGFKDPAICFVLNEEEYIEILYAMYKSDLTPEKYKPIFNGILEKICQ